MQPEIVFYTALPGPYPGAPHPAGARDYCEVLGPRSGWKRLLEDRTCLVLCPPWGLWAPYVRTIEPENWSPTAEGLPPDMTWLEYLRDHHDLQDLDPDGVGAFGEVDPDLLFQKELWKWAAKPTSTTVIMLPSPGPELPHRTGIGFAGHALLNHLIPNFGFRPASGRVERDDLRDVEDEHQPWVKALGLLWAGSAFEPGRYSRNDILDGLSSEDIDDNFENSRFIRAKDTLPHPPLAPDLQVADLELIAHPRGDEGLGVAVHGRVGEGDLVVVMTDPLKESKQVKRLRSASLLLHGHLHRDSPSADGHEAKVALERGHSAPSSPGGELHDDGGGTISLSEVTAILSEVGFEERTWTYDAVRHRLKRDPDRDPDGFFAKLKACRLPGERGKFPRKGFRAILRPRLAQITAEWEESRLTKQEIRAANEARVRFSTYRE